MKYMILLVLAMIAAPVKALDNSVPSVAAYSTTMTVTGITISSFTPTSVVISTSPQYRDVCVQNVSGVAALFCSDSVNLSTQAASLNAVVLSTFSVPAVPFCFPLVAGKNFYCQTGALNTTSKAIVILGR